MSILHLYTSVTGISQIKSLTYRDSMSQATANAEVVCVTNSNEVGASVNVDFGLVGDHQVYITGGIVKGVKTVRPDGHKVVTIHDVLSKAVDYFIAADNDASAYFATNRKAENVVGDMLSLAGITNYAFDVSPLAFTFGVVNPVKIDLTSAWAAIENVNRITTFHTWADTSGQVQYRDRPAYITGSDVSTHTYTTGSGSGDIISIEYSKSDLKLRNRIVVHGAPGIDSTSSGSSPYLPAGFFKSVVLEHELIDSQNAANLTASRNLTQFNRLTETCRLTTRGITGIQSRSIVAINESLTGLTPATLWLVFASTHTLDKSGWKTELTLVR